MKKKYKKPLTEEVRFAYADDLCQQGGGTGDVQTSSSNIPQTGGFGVPIRRLYI